MANYIKMANSVLNLPASFAIGFIVLYVRSVLSVTTIVNVPDSVDGLMLLAGSIFLLFHCISNYNIYKGYHIFAIVVLCIGFLSYLRSGETVPFVVVLTVLAAAVVDDIDNVVRLWLGCTVALMTFLMALFTIVMIIDPQSIKFVIRLSEDGVSRQRFSFFFSHPNMFGAIVLMACSAFVYLNQNRIGPIHYVFLFCTAGFVFFASGSRTSSFLIVLLVFISFLQKSKGIFDSVGVRRLVGILPIAAFAAILLVSGLLYRDSLGSLLTGRVALWHACFANQGVSLFGQVFVPSTSVGPNGWVYYYSTLDCAYAQGLYVLGVAFSLWFSWAVWKCAICETCDSGRVLPALLVMILFGITEVHIFTFSICYVLLLLGKPLLEKLNKGGLGK